MTGAQGQIRVLSSADVTRLLDPGQAMLALAEGFKALSRGDVQAPPRPKVDVPHKGFSLGMLAWAPGHAIALKTVNVFEGNHARGLPSHQALIGLFDPDTGAPIAVMDGAVITGVRTAAAAILTVRELARADARVATVVGGGVQGREHVRLLRLARNFTEIRIASRSPESARRIAEAAGDGVRAVTELEAAVRTSDVVCLTTSAASPVIQSEWIRPGTHVTSVGFAPPGGEVPRGLLERAALYVESRNAFSPPPVGSAELQGLDPQHGIEVGELLLGIRPGRTAQDQITLYKSAGNAMEDMVVANLVYEAAKARNIGQTIAL